MISYWIAVHDTELMSSDNAYLCFSWEPLLSFGYFAPTVHTAATVSAAATLWAAVITCRTFATVSAAATVYTTATVSAAATVYTTAVL
jgi:hypothetical protein